MTVEQPKLMVRAFSTCLIAYPEDLNGGVALIQKSIIKVSPKLKKYLKGMLQANLS